MSHTPRPWLIREMHAGNRRYRIEIIAPINDGRGEHPICQIPSGFTNQDEDAHLIIAAPELLNASKRIIELWGDDDNDPEYNYREMMTALRNLRAAIAKAEGSNP